MIETLKLLWKDNKGLVTGFVLALAVMVFFAVRSIMFWIYWSDPAHRNQAIEGWMTPRYVAHSWHVPPQVVRDALELSPETGRVTIGQLAEQRGEPFAEVAAKIITAIEAARAEREAERGE